MVRTIKLWTKRRGIYGYVYCFMNGIAIEITAARIVKMNYEQNILELMKEYFETYIKWDYSRNPVILDTTATDRVERKKEEVVQIITLAKPRQNCVFNMTKSSLTLIKDEMKRGLELVNKALSGEPMDWNYFFKSRHLFCRYYVFIEFCVKLKMEEMTFEELENMINKFSSKFAQLIRMLEEDENLIEANALPKEFPDAENECIYFYVGLKVKDNVPVDISTSLNIFLENVNKAQEYSVDACIKKRSEIQTQFAHAVGVKKEDVEHIKEEEIEEEEKELKDIKKELLEMKDEMKDQVKEENRLTKVKIEGK